jgi:hypothetical protein
VILFAAAHPGALHAKQPVFVPLKIDGPVHDPEKGTYWYGPFSEGSALIDLNGDGKLDISCGPNWYESPTWKKHEGFRPGATVQGEFINNCGEFPMDVNGDGRSDLVSAGWMSNGVYWYENPGKPEGVGAAPWTAHKLIDSEWTEGFIVEDIDGDGDQDILINHWAPKDGQGLTWLEKVEGARFEPRVLGKEGDHHGTGIGDLNGDGRKDIVCPEGWWEAPEDRAKGSWKFHADFRLKGEPGIRIVVHDVNGDGRADLIHGNAHGYGLWWEEQLPPAGGKLRFEERLICEQHGQYHTLVLADVNQDGTLDLVTGKRLRGHNDGDDSSFDPLGVYWFEIAGGRFHRHVLAFNHLYHYAPTETHNPPPNAAIGAGMNITVADLTGDGKVEILVSGKSGCYLFVNRGLPPTKKMR